METIHRHKDELAAVLVGPMIAGIYVPELDAWILIMLNAVGAEHGPRRSYFGIADALLEADGGFSELLGVNAELRHGAFGAAPDQQFTGDEIQRLTGSYLTPEGGGVLQIVDVS